MKFLITLLLSLVFTANSFAGFIGNRNPIATTITNSITISAGEIAVVKPLSMDCTLDGNEVAIKKSRSVSVTGTTAPVEIVSNDDMNKKVVIVYDETSGTTTLRSFLATSFGWNDTNDDFELYFAQYASYTVDTTVTYEGGIPKNTALPSTNAATTVGAFNSYITTNGNILYTGSSSGSAIKPGLYAQCDTTCGWTITTTVYESLPDEITVPAGTVLAGGNWSVTRYNL